MIKCISIPEFELWLREPATVTRTSYGVSKISSGKNDAVLRMNFPLEILPHIYIANDILRWASFGNEFALLVNDWPAYTPEQMHAFRAFRRGIGEKRTLIESPAHILSQSDIFFVEDEYTQEMGELGGLLFMVMCFDWKCYVISKSLERCVHIDDTFVYFSSENNSAIDEAALMAKKYGLEAILLNT